MLEVEPALWLFVKQPEVGLTNNEAERALRHAVLWRRVSFGSQSAKGAEMVGRLLTVVMTLKRRGESVHKYLGGGVSSSTRRASRADVAAERDGSTSDSSDLMG